MKLMDDSLPPAYEVSNNINMAIANKFYFNNNLVTNCKDITSSKTNQVEYKLAIGKFHKEFYIHIDNNVRLITFKLNELSSKSTKINIIYDNEKCKGNFALAEIELGYNDVLTLIDYNNIKHKYTLEKEKHKVNLYYSNPTNNKILIGNGNIDIDKGKTQLGYFNFTIQIDKHLESLILAMISIHISFKELYTKTHKKTDYSYYFKHYK